ncbi:MAG: hypothetical protein AAFQ79_09770 [Pseudomonadota bacterium]
MSRLRVPSFITITEVSPPGAATPDYVITNPATGGYFGADIATVQFIDALRRTGDPALAATAAQIQRPHAEALIKQFRSHGILAGDPGEQAGKRRGPVEGKLISFRFDLFDAGGIARALHGLGRAAFSLPGLVLWLGLLVAAAVALARNGDKVTLTLAQVAGYGWAEFAGLVTLYVGLKLIHELGHILAYRVFCLREGHDPGPIRTGIMVFAATPFPFTDVTGAWRLRSRWRRAAIGAGGIYFEVFAVTILTLIWAGTSAGPWHALILQVAVFSGAMTLVFNLNPAIKLDGYYILTDLLRQPNLSVRASQAARGWAARRLGAEAGPVEGVGLGYWVISYAYRWTIFAAVFWIAYQFDPRLAPVVAVVAVLLLVVRPLIATLRFARARGARLGRMVLAGGVAAAVVAALFVPTPARLLLDGQLLHYRSDYLRPPEPARVMVDPGKAAVLTLEQPDLAQTQTDLALRREILVALSRAVAGSAAEAAAVRQDLANMDRLMAEVGDRIKALDLTVPEGAVWTPLAAERHDGAWVLPTMDEPLGAVSRPVDPYLRLTLPQDRLDAALDDPARQVIAVRLVSDPDCGFAARLTAPPGDAVAEAGVLVIEARPDGPLPECAADLPNGAATVARIALPHRSLAEQTRRLVARLLQNRLPIDQDTTL